MKQIKFFNAPQRSPEWFNHRKGRATSSKMSNIMFTDKPTAGFETYVFEKIAELISDWEPLFKGNSATDWGNFHEPFAFDAYGVKYNVEMNECGFVDYKSFAGGSPDGYHYNEFGDLCVIEIKCPETLPNHFKVLNMTTADELKKYNKIYYWQLYANMFFCDAEISYFVSYSGHEKTPDYLRTHRIEMHRDEKIDKLMVNCLDQFEHRRDEIIANLELL